MTVKEARSSSYRKSVTSGLINNKKCSFKHHYHFHAAIPLVKNGFACACFFADKLDLALCVGPLYTHTQLNIKIHTRMHTRTLTNKYLYKDMHTQRAHTRTHTFHIHTLFHKLYRKDFDCSSFPCRNPPRRLPSDTHRLIVLRIHLLQSWNLVTCRAGVHATMSDISLSVCVIVCVVMAG